MEKFWLSILPDRFVLVGLLACWVILGSPVLYAGDEETMATPEAAPDTIDTVIEERDTLLYDRGQRSLFRDKHYEYRELLYEWERKIGLEVTLSYDALVQGYLDAEGGLGGTAGDLTLSGKWLLFGNKFIKPFTLSFRIRNRHSFSGYTPSDFGPKADLLWGTVDGFNDSGTQIPSFYLSQVLARDTLTVHYGQFSVDSFFDSHSLRSAKRYFLNQLFSSNPTVGFPRFGAGAIGRFAWKDKMSVMIGVSNIQGTEIGKKVSLDITSSALFEALQADYYFSGMRGKDAKLQVMVWNSDKNGENLSTGNGLSLTLEHEGTNKGEQIILRYACSDGESTNSDIALFLTYGKQFTEYNQFGVGIGAGRSAISAEWQGVLEVYYKIQLAKELTLTPDLQFIIGDDTIDENQLSFVVGVRMGLAF